MQCQGKKRQIEWGSSRLFMLGPSLAHGQHGLQPGDRYMWSHLLFRVHHKTEQSRAEQTHKENKQLGLTAVEEGRSEQEGQGTGGMLHWWRRETKVNIHSHALSLTNTYTHARTINPPSSEGQLSICNNNTLGTTVDPCLTRYYQAIDITQL